ncbi:MAG TPA: winged helix-turn-helix domain-containing protein [Nitrososphaerales archaeon]|nr:winged helix-turn-helix domain-containing protein [Nitrososphaerales archaeon]
MALAPGTLPLTLLASFMRAEGQTGAQEKPIDPSFKRVMVYLFVGTRGGQNRTRIVEMLKAEPSNPNRISERLGLDYKTVQHHLRLLEDNGVVVSSSKGTYGAIYFLTPYFEKYFDPVKAMWEGFG